MSIKQSEVNKRLNDAIKAVGARFGWSYRSGVLFVKKGLLFFDLVLTGRAAANVLSVRLGYKLFEFDDLFWKIVGLEENAKRPLSFRADGAWTVPVMQIFEDRVPHSTWEPESLATCLEPFVARADEAAQAASKRIQNLDDNLAFLEERYAELRKAYPAMTINLYKERLLTAVLKENAAEALRIASERIAQHDTGGFSVESKSFFVLARDYIQTILER